MVCLPSGGKCLTTGCRGGGMIVNTCSTQFPNNNKICNTLDCICHIVNWFPQNVIEDFCQTLASVAKLWLQFDHDLTELHPIPNRSIVVKFDMSSAIKLFLILIQIIITKLASLSAWALLVATVLAMVLDFCAVARFGTLFINSLQNSWNVMIHSHGSTQALCLSSLDGRMFYERMKDTWNVSHVHRSFPNMKHTNIFVLTLLNFSVSDS